MVVFVLMLLFSLGISAVIMLYAAYPYRGLEMPYKPEFGESLRRWADALPVLEPDIVLAPAYVAETDEDFEDAEDSMLDARDAVTDERPHHHHRGAA